MSVTKISLRVVCLAVLMVLSSSCQNIGRHALEKATENLEPATQNIEDATQNIEDATGNIEDAVKELKNTIAQLEASSINLVGALGDEMQDVIGEFSTSANAVIKQTEKSTIKVIKQTEKSTLRVIKALTASGKSLLQEVNKLIRDNLKCMDEITAKRIAQITDAAFDIIDQFNVLLNTTIQTIADETQETISLAGQEASLLVSRTTYNVVNILLIIAALLFFIFPIYLYMFKVKRSSNVFKKVVGPSLSGLLGVACIALFLMPGQLWAALGYAVITEDFDFEASCGATNAAYTDFIRLYNSQPTDKSLYLEAGLHAIDLMNSCSYGNPDNNMIRDKQRLAENIEALLFPPPAPDRNTIDYADCRPASSGGPKWFHPSFFSQRTQSKVVILNDLYKAKQIRVSPIAYKATAVTTLAEPQAPPTVRQYNNLVRAEFNVDVPRTAKATLRTRDLRVQR